MIRTFIALELPDETLDEILAVRDYIFGEMKDLRWERRDKLHITLKFLGDADKNVLDQLSEDLEKLIAQQNKFRLTFDKFGIFKSNNIPKILWIGAEHDPKLSELANLIDEICKKYSYPKETRAFKTHITLLRIKNDFYNEKITECSKQKFNEITAIADKVTLFQSQLFKHGSVYTPIKSFIIKNSGGK
ncbi:MAG: RNA 2',3'-cyclic phosphodiesterase [Bacteroidota bacterium]